MTILTGGELMAELRAKAHRDALNLRGEPPTPTSRIGGIRVAFTCPRCSGPLERAKITRVGATRSEMTTVCPACDRTMRVHVSLTDLGHRWPFEPVVADCTKGDPPTPAELAQLFDTDRNAIYRWASDGLTRFMADYVACRRGVHPSHLWPDWYDHDDDTEGVGE